MVEVIATDISPNIVPEVDIPTRPVVPLDRPQPTTPNKKTELGVFDELEEPDKDPTNTPRDPNNRWKPKMN